MMIDGLLLAALLLGLAAALRVERVRLAGLRLRVATEVEGLAAWVDRRRAPLAYLAQELPAALPACHAGLELLGRSQRAALESLAILRRAPTDRGAAELLVQAQASFDRGLGDLRQDAPRLASLEALHALAPSIETRHRAVTDAVRHQFDRRARG